MSNIMELTIGGPVKTTVDPVLHYDLCCTPDWLKSDLAHDILKDICKAKSVTGLTYVRPFWYEPYEDVVMSYKEMGSSVKNLLCMLNDPDAGVFELTKCGENCAKWIGEIMKLHPLKCRLGYSLPLDGFTMHITNDDTYIDNRYDLNDKVFYWMRHKNPNETIEEEFEPIYYLREYLDILPFASVQNCTTKEQADKLIELAKNVNSSSSSEIFTKFKELHVYK